MLTNRILPFMALLPIIFTNTNSLVFNDAVHKVQMSGATCVLDVAHKFFAEYSTIAFVKVSTKSYSTNFNLGISTDDLIMQRLFGAGSWTIMMKYYTAETQSKVATTIEFGFEKIHNYVIVFQNLQMVEHTLGELSGMASWNPHANFLIYVDGIVIKWREFCAELIKIFWKYWVINLTIMIPSEEIYGHLFVAWFPFHDGHCAADEGNFTTLGICKDSVLEPTGFDCFPNKIPKDMNRCRVKVGVVNSPPFVIEREDETTAGPYVDLSSGIEMKILNAVAWRANFDVQLLLSYESDQMNASGGLLQELAERKFEIAIGTISPTIAAHRQFDFSVQYTQDVATWVVPSDNMMPQWLGLLLVFQPTAYAATFLLLTFFWLISTSIVKVFRINFRNEYACYKNRISFLLITVGILFANIPSKFPKTTFLKYLMIVWILFCLHWSTAYNGTLMSVLTSTVFTSGIETEQEIIAMKMNLAMTNRTMRYFNRLSEDPADNSHQNKVIMKLCLNAKDCLREMALKRDSALSLSRGHFEFIKNEFRDEQGNFRVKALKTNIVTSPIEMLLSKGSPLLPRINQILLDIIGSGLIDYWTKNITRNEMSAQDEANYKGEKVLKLENLKGGFFLMFMGLAISFITFIAEIFYYHNRTKQQYPQRTVRSP